MRRKDLCKQETALDMLKAQPKKGGLSSSHIKLLEAQAADYKAQQEEIKMLGVRMTELEKSMTEVKTDVALVKSDVKVIKDLLEKRNKTIWDKIPILKDVPTLAWILLMIIVGMLGSMFGANLEWIQYLKNIGA